MAGLTLDLLIGALVAATFGFSGIITSSAGVARAVAIGLFALVVVLLLPGLSRALRPKARRGRRARPAIPLIRVQRHSHGAEYGAGLRG